MRLKRRLLAATVTTGAVALIGGAGAASAVAPSTDANALTAMHGEAYAHAKYIAYGAVAAQRGNQKVAGLFNRTAAFELNHHFTEEAALIRYGASNMRNLRAAVAGETFESTTMYPGFAATARAEGCKPAAKLFTEIAQDEKHHAAAFKAALDVLTTGKGTVPPPPALSAVPFRATLPACHGRTLANLTTAMKGESFANASYTLYARHAAASGHGALARLFAGSAQVELREHFAAESRLAGLVRRIRANLHAAIAGETFEGTRMYPRFAAQARKAGDRAAAKVFSTAGHEELSHARQFKAALPFA